MDERERERVKGVSYFKSLFEAIKSCEKNPSNN